MRLDGINRLLEDVFKEPRLLSDILHDAGMGEDEIARLRHDHLDAYLGGLLRRWRSWMAQILPSRRDDIIVRRYGLNGRPQPTWPSSAMSTAFRVSVSANWRKML
jgi:hypothetical protein